MSEEFVIGIDKGTSVVKAVAFDRQGHEAALARRRVTGLHPHPGWHEEDPDRSWNLTLEALGEAVESLPDGAEVVAVGVTAHMGGAWLVDGDGRPVRNGICWNDGRAKDVQNEMEDDGRLRRFFEITGNAPMPGVTVMILRHLLRHEPEVVAQAEHVLNAKDFLRMRLTGEYASEPSDVSWVPGDAETQQYSDEVFEICGISETKRLFPPIIPSGSIAGRISAGAATATGLTAGTPVVAGLGDVTANSVGSGVIHAGQALTVLGTSCLNCLVVDDVELEPFGLGFLWTLPNDTRIRVLPNTGGQMSVDWMLETVCGNLRDGDTFRFDEVEQLIADTPPGAGGVVFIPYMNAGGVLAPFFDSLARGSIFGLTAQTTPGQLARAAFEGLSFAVRDCYEAMPFELPELIRVTGGGAGSDLLCQLMADSIGHPVEVLGITETGAAGVAMLGAVAVGMAEDLEEVTSRWCQPAKVFQPDEANRKELQQAFELYGSVRDALRPLSKQRQLVEEAGNT